MMREIRVLVVEDSLLFRELLVTTLNKDPAITVVAAVRDPFEARDAIIEHRPDVMTLDIELPRMDGIEFLRKLMPQYPMPVVMISAFSDRVFDALNAGAVEFVAKPSGNDRKQLEAFVQNELPVKIKIASTAKIGNIKRNTRMSDFANHKSDKKILAIGASTGGTEAIFSLLHELRTDVPGIVVVQHMPAGFTQMYANRLNDKCSLTVREAKTGDVVRPGQVLIAPGGDKHMRVVKGSDGYQVECKSGEKVNGHAPSVDELFYSVARAAGENAMGILLTGMGSDGAKGLLEMRKAGGSTIGQDESTCVVYGMPKVAYDIGAVMYQERLSDIPGRVYSLLRM